ncbi:MAG TPA: two-component regulator propeller domain-containing protein, partial [Chitinophagaceae bacterium]|nr:two-component regulator propeller domain-containing protein [Chitinophagaceae bacterium]
MKRIVNFIFCLLITVVGYPQAATIFNRISTEDAMGLASNQVNSLHQDSRGFIWVGTANGLQRFDGIKFVRLANMKKPAPIDEVNRIVEDKKGRLWLSFINRREFGIFDPSDNSYSSVPIKVKGEIPVRSEFYMWMNRRGDIYLNISGFKILRYNEKENAFLDDAPFKLPEGWKLAKRVFEDTVKDHLYFLSGDSGLAVYDYGSREIWTHRYNPKNIAVLNNFRVQDRITTFFIDSKRRNWIFHWPVWGGGTQFKHCLDSNGRSLTDTTGFGLDIGYNEFHDFYETSSGELWVNGLNILFSSDSLNKKFRYYRSETKHNYNIEYDVVNQVMEDRDGSIWIATDKGLFITNTGGVRYVSNLLFDESSGNTFINDILQVKNGDYWFANWGKGVTVLDKQFRKKEPNIYGTPVPASWPQATKNAKNGTWSLHQESRTGLVWIGFLGGILNIHDPVKGVSKWMLPEEFGGRTIRIITEDPSGTLWFGTQGGRVIRYDNGEFRIVQDFQTIIEKVFVDRQNLIWVSALNKGLYAIDKESGKVIQHYHKDDEKNPTYSNTANDIEQLNDSIIVYGAGALNFINKRTGKVNIYSFKDGLPSNTIQRLRMDKQGYLWIMTTSGLCRYNPANNKITPYGRKDGIMFSDLAKSCDYVSDEGLVMFGGENAV